MHEKELPENLKQYIRKLEQIRTDFVANVSHELRTPLTIIKGYVEWLLKQENKQEFQTVLEKIHQHSNRMNNLLEDLLLLSRLEEHSTMIEEGVIEVAKLLERIAEEAKQLNHFNHHDIALSVDPHLGLLGSESELKSVFTNLIYNAVKYTPAYGCIRIEWIREQNSSVFKVTDNGIGIAKKHLPRITERFYRVDKARSREKGGTGLGLAIVKHVLLNHQATLDITSQYRKGSVFSCRFPSTRTKII